MCPQFFTHRAILFAYEVASTTVSSQCVQGPIAQATPQSVKEREEKERESSPVVRLADHRLLGKYFKSLCNEKSNVWHRVSGFRQGSTFAIRFVYWKENRRNMTRSLFDLLEAVQMLDSLYGTFSHKIRPSRFTSVLCYSCVALPLMRAACRPPRASSAANIGRATPTRR